MVPSVYEDLFCGFLVLVVSKHGVAAPCQYLARDSIWVWRVNLHFHVIGLTSAASYSTVFPVVICDDWCAFCRTIADGYWETNICEECLNFLVQRSATNNHLVHPSTECLVYLLAYLGFKLCAYNRCLHKSFDRCWGNLRQYLLLYDFLYNKRYGDDDAWTNIGECLCHNGWRRYSGKIIDMASCHKFVDELKGHAIHMCHWKNWYRIVSRFHILS